MYVSMSRRASICFNDGIRENSVHRAVAVTPLISRYFYVCTPMVESYGVGIVYQLVGRYL